MTLAIADLGTILSVWAHPDDETFLAGGVMAMARERGQRVVCVSATAGEHGTDDPATWPPERLGRLRREEAAAAMRILGVEDHRWLGLEDGTLAGADPEEGMAQVGALLDDVAPGHHPHLRARRDDLPPGPRGGPHVGDRGVAAPWTGPCPPVRHGRAGGPPPVRRRNLETWGVYMTDERPVPVAAADLALHERLTGAVLDRKIAALEAMPSQIAPSLDLLGAAVFRELNTSESFVAA